MFPVYSGEVEIRVGKALLKGVLRVPKDTIGGVLFAHGSGSSRLSLRNRFVADVLHRSGFATLLFDLLTVDEQSTEAISAELRSNISFLTKRLVGVTDWFSERTVHSLPLGYFGVSVGAAAALIASVERPNTIEAVVTRGGRPDLAGEDALTSVTASSLFIVAADDKEILELNRQALSLLPAARKEIVVVTHATHQFEESGALEKVAECATEWFGSHLGNVAMLCN